MRAYEGEAPLRSWRGPVAGQGKFVLGRPGDAAEHAADRVAGDVVRGWGRGEIAPAPFGGGGLAAADRLDRETERAIDGARQGGAPLDRATRSVLEPAFGADLGRVRLHGDERAGDLCHEIQARAFTVGDHVFFGNGRPDLASPDGRNLLAHELAHVAQPSAPGMVRRTYLNGDHDWATASTHTLFGRTRARSPAMQAVDAAVADVRQAYDAGVLGTLEDRLTTLTDRIEDWEAARPAWRARLRGREVRDLKAQVTALEYYIQRWRGALLQQARARHLRDHDNARRWLDEGLALQNDFATRNSCEWILSRKARLYIVTETADHGYRAKVLARQRGQRITTNTCYFPDPNAGRGGVGQRSPDLNWYNVNHALDMTNVVEEPTKRGWNRPGRYVAITEDGCKTRDDFWQTLRHEVQHDADKHRGTELSRHIRPNTTAAEQRYQRALREYKTEYRAHYYQRGAPFQGHLPQGIEQHLGLDWGPRQWAIFHHLRTEYPEIGFFAGRYALGQPANPRQQRFRLAAQAYRNPDAEGFNKINSIRIDDLYNALDTIGPKTVDATAGTVTAAIGALKRLNPTDLAYFRDDDQAQMLRDKVYAHLDGAALLRFRAELQQMP